MKLVWGLIIGIGVLAIFVTLFNVYYLRSRMSPEKKNRLLQDLSDEKHFLRGVIAAENSRSSRDKDERELRKLKHRLAALEFKISKLQ